MQVRQYRYSAASRKVLDTCHPDLIRVFEAVLPIHDHTIMRGVRTLQQQKAFEAKGWSRTLNSRHLPGGGLVDGKVADPDGFSYAIDVRPYPLPSDVGMHHYYFFAGVVLATAHAMGIDLRWGGDWDSDNDLYDQNFMDLVHFEIRR